MKYNVSEFEMSLVKRVLENAPAFYREVTYVEQCDDFRYDYRLSYFDGYVDMELREYWRDTIVRTVDISFEVLSCGPVYQDYLAQIWVKVP